VLVGPAAHSTIAEGAVIISSNRSRGDEIDRDRRLPRFEVEDLVDGGRHTLILSGELDMRSSADLEATTSRRCEEGAARLVLDMSRLTFMDVMGLRIVLFAKELCEWHGCEFELVPGPPCVQRVFELTNLLDALPFGPDHETMPQSDRSSRAAS
jgi:anti-anti-sigma factor